MANKNMKKLKLLLLANIPVDSARFPRNYSRLFNREQWNEHFKGWPSHFTTKRIK